MGIFLSMIQNQKADADAEYPSGRELCARSHAAVLGRPEPAQSSTARRCSSAASRFRPTIRAPCAASLPCSPAGTGTTPAAAIDSTRAAFTTRTAARIRISGAARATTTIRRGNCRCNRSRHYHDNTSDKQLLVYAGVALPGGVLVHGGDAQTELTAALDNIFNHPNVGPFIAMRLIQRLVTSNPSRPTCSASRRCSTTTASRRARRSAGPSSRRSCSIRKRVTGSGSIRTRSASCASRC